MAHSLIDLYNSILKYGNTEIDIILDDNGISWYQGSTIAGLLQYRNTRKAIEAHVLPHNKKLYSELEQYQLNPKQYIQFLLMKVDYIV